MSGSSYYYSKDCRRVPVPGFTGSDYISRGSSTTKSHRPHHVALVLFLHSLPPRGFELGRSSPRALVMAAFFNKSLVWKELSGFTKPVVIRASQECVHKGDASPAGDVDPPTVKSITPRLPRHSLNILCHHHHHQSRVPPELKTLFAPSPLEKVLVIGGQRLLTTTRRQH